MQRGREKIRRLKNSLRERNLQKTMKTSAPMSFFVRLIQNSQVMSPGILVSSLVNL